MKGCLAVLEADKRTWEEEKWQMQEMIDELNEYNTPEDKSPTALVIKSMPDMSLKDQEITQLKEANQELKDMITAKESEDSSREIRTLKEKIARFE